ncbi:LapA family protein [Candidatus Woesebacteria bacterium]|nr:MAG: LapA family protein [Candidatus Woesebacteria bacterium]
MLTSIFVVVFGVVFAYFATINTNQISVNFGFYQLTNSPIYLVVLISAAIGMLLTAVLYFLRFMSTYFTIGSKEKDIKEANKRIAELTKDLHKIELENERLRTKAGNNDYDEDSL